MITQGVLKYEVIGDPPDEYTRIWLKDVNRHFYDAFPANERMHLDEETGQYYHIKVFRRRKTEIWLVCNEDENGNHYGTLAPNAILELAAESGK